MKPKTPKEDPADKRAREQERLRAERERSRAANENAGDLTDDLRSVYGLARMKGKVVRAGSPAVVAAPARKPRPHPGRSFALGTFKPEGRDGRSSW